VKTESGRGCDDILYNPDDMEKVFFLALHVWLIRALNELTAPEREASRFLSPTLYASTVRLGIVFHFINYA
jgi:hypothetical protein